MTSLRIAAGKIRDVQKRKIPHRHPGHHVPNVRLRLGISQFGREGLNSPGHNPAVGSKNGSNSDFHWTFLFTLLPFI